MSHSTSSSQNRAQLPWLVVAGFVVVVAALRLFAAHFGELTEGDEILISDSIATLSNDGLGAVYRYGPQLGYYRIVEWLAGMFGGTKGIPIAMVLLSAVAGTVIPALGLFAFRSELSPRERGLFGVLLTLNPALWTAATYGNTAILSVALTCCAVTLLSNRPARGVELLSLVLFGGAILVRADAVLASGAIGLILWRNHASALAAFVRVAAVGAALLAVYGTLFATDPQMAGTLSTVADHLKNEFPTLFWDLLLWAVSPIPLAFAVLGLRELEPRRRWMLAILVAWILPFFAFYFGNTTTPRYHLQAIFPISVASSVGVWAFTQHFTRWRPGVAAIALAAVCAHAFVAVGRYVPGKDRNWLNGGSIGTHDGEFSTGAFLYKAFRWDLPHTMRHLTTRYELPVALARWAEELATGRYADRHVLVIADGVYSPLLHWTAQLNAADITSYHPREDATRCEEFTFTLARARVTTSDLPRLRDAPACRLPAAVGDELWIVQPRSTTGTTLPRARLAPLLDIALISDSDPLLHRYRIVPAS